jgi:hypothetical protein
MSSNFPPNFTTVHRMVARERAESERFVKMRFPVTAERNAPVQLCSHKHLCELIDLFVIAIANQEGFAPCEVHPKSSLLTGQQS